MTAKKGRAHLVSAVMRSTFSTRKMASGVCWGSTDGMVESLPNRRMAARVMPSSRRSGSFKINPAPRGNSSSDKDFHG